MSCMTKDNRTAVQDHSQGLGITNQSFLSHHEDHAHVNTSTEKTGWSLPRAIVTVVSQVGWNLVTFSELLYHQFRTLTAIF